MRRSSFWEGKLGLLDGLLMDMRTSGLKRIGIAPSSRVLEIGSWLRATNLLKLKNLYPDAIYTAMDLRLDSCFLSGQWIWVCEWNLEHWLLVDDEQDVIIATAVIEHIENELQLIKKCYELLNPWGLMYVTVPSIYAQPILEILGSIWLINKLEISDHKRYYTKNKLINIFQEWWFNIDKMDHRYFQCGMNNLFIVRK